LLPVFVDEPDSRHADRVVDPGLGDRTDGLYEPSRSQRDVTKPPLSSCSNDETATQAARYLVVATRLNLHGALPFGESALGR
jgi:hypothetical protein